MEYGGDSPAAGRSEAEQPVQPSGARPLLNDWLSLTERLLGEFDLTVAELQELVAMQGKVKELIDRSSGTGPDNGEEGDEGERPTFRRVL